MGSQDGEKELEQQVQHAKAEYCRLLNDLASLKLAKGRHIEAQQLLTQLAALQQPHLSVSIAASTVSDNPSSLPHPPPFSSRTQGTADLKPATSHPTQTQTDSQTSTPQQAPSIATHADTDADDWESSEPTLLTAPQQQSTAQSAPQSVPGSSSTASTDSQPASTSRRAPTDTSSKPVHSSRQSTTLSTQAEDDVPVVNWDGGFDHCVEIYDLNPSVKTSHLQSMLDVLLPDARMPPWIRWVDDNHAVYVCGSVTDAQRLLDSNDVAKYPMRPWSEATQQSKQLPMSELLPPKPRPKTTAAVARKLLSHALGMPNLRDRRGEQQLAQARRDARQDRQARREAAASVWGDEDADG